MNKHTKSFLAILIAFVLAFGALGLTGCTGGGDEQDNCYGEDMPVENN